MYHITSQLPLCARNPLAKTAIGNVVGVASYLIFKSSSVHCTHQIFFTVATGTVYRQLKSSHPHPPNYYSFFHFLRIQRNIIWASLGKELFIWDGFKTQWWTQLVVKAPWSASCAIILHGNICKKRPHTLRNQWTKIAFQCLTLCISKMFLKLSALLVHSDLPWPLRNSICQTILYILQNRHIVLPLVVQYLYIY